MPGEKTAQTGWVIIATEGATVDGRAITKSWIEEMAANYSLDEYTALIWPEHFRSSWAPYEGKNWGTVDELKASKKGGKLRLFAKLSANQYLLEANKDGQKLYTSIEVNPDFANSGKAYLQGLAVTDSPASTGTTRLKFSMGNNEIERNYSELEPLNRNDFIFTNSNTPSTEEQATSLFKQLLNLFSTSQTAAAQTNIAEEDNTMTQEQLDALMGKFGEVTAKLDGFETKFTTLEEKVNTFSAAPAADATPEEQPPVEQQVITAEQFSQLTESLTGLTTKFDSLDNKFNALSKETAGQEPSPTGGETVALV